MLTKRWEDFDRAPGYKGHHGEGTEFPIFLPFWDKRVEKHPWLSMWRKAFERLKQASNLIVWGYSLPQTDVKAQQLFSLACMGRKFNLCVIDPSSATRERWRELAPDAKCWEYYGIADFLKYPPKWWGHSNAEMSPP